MNRIFLTLIVCLLFSVSGLPQTPTPPPPPVDSGVVQINTNLIQIDAIVTNKKGKQVTNLTADDFEISENGQKKKISYFSYVSLSKRTSTEAETETRTVSKTDARKGIFIPSSKLSTREVRRTYAIVVDDLGISYENMKRVKRTLRKFIAEEVSQGDLVAIIRTGRGTGALQSFTSDKRQLLAAVEAIRWNAYGRIGVSSFAPIKPTLKEELANMPDGDGGSTTPMGIEGDLEFEQETENLRRQGFELGTLGALNWVVRGMDKLSGRKSVVLFSEGFSTFDRDGLPNNVFDRLRELTEYANRSSVTFYTVDPRGLISPSATAADDIREVVPTDPLLSKTPRLDTRTRTLRETQSTLRFLAYETGGVPFVNNNNLKNGLDKAVGDQQGYYLIAYVPDEDTFDEEKVEFRDVEVTVNKDGLDVRTRNGFFSVPDKPETKTGNSAEQQILSAITSPFDASEISLTLNTLFSKGGDGKEYLRSLVYLKGKDLEFKATKKGKLAANFDILAFTFGDSNTPVSEASRNYTITIEKEDLEKARKSGFVYTLDVPMKKKGAYQFRVAVRDSNSSKVGSASQFVIVPNLKKNHVALSGIALTRYSSKEWKLISNGKPVPELSANRTNVDNALREFSVGDVLQFGYEIYNANLKREILLRTRLIKDGKIVAEGKPSPLDKSDIKDPKRIEAFGAITLGRNLDPGDYVLQVIVTDANSNKRSRTTTQWVEFKIKSDGS